MNRKVSILLVVLAALGLSGAGIAGYFALLRPEVSPVTHISWSAENSAPATIPDGTSNHDNSVPRESDSAARTITPESNLGSATSSPKADRNGRPALEADLPRYQRKMQLGVKRALLYRDTPLEWLRQYLKSVPTVESLGLAPDATTPEVIDMIAESGNVEQISVGAVHLLSDEGAKALQRLKGVHGLSISTNRPYSTNSGPVEEELNPWIESYLEMPDLTSLSISGTINDELLRDVSELSQLEMLRLDNDDDLRRHDKITTAGLLYLSRLSRLSELVMINFTVGRHHIDLDRLAEVMSGFPALERLSLSGWKVADRHLIPCLSVLSRLKYLNLNQTDVTDEFYGRIDSTWMLEDLCAPGIGDAGIRAASSAPNLKRISVGKNVTDAGIQSLASQAPALESVRISYADITDASLVALSGCPALKEVGVRHTEGITAPALKTLCAERRIETLDCSLDEFVNRAYIEDVLSATESLRTLIYYPFSSLTLGERQSLMDEYPNVTIQPVPSTSQWYR